MIETWRNRPIGREKQGGTGQLAIVSERGAGSRLPSFY